MCDSGSTRARLPSESARPQLTIRDPLPTAGENDFTVCVVDESGNSTESLHTFVRTESASELLPLDAALALFETDAPLDDVTIDLLAAERLEVK